MMKRIALILSCFILLSCFLCGCQATPEEPIVIQKDTDRLVEQLQDEEKTETTALDKNSIPQRMEKEFQGKTGKITIKVDADITVPEVEKLPVYRVKAADFSQETVTMMFDRFRDGEEMFTFPKIETKTQIAEKLLLARKQQEERENDPTFKYDTELIESGRAAIEQLLQDYEKAPETIEGEPCDGTLKEAPYYIDEEKVIGTYYTVGAEDKERTFSFSTENNVDVKKIPKGIETETETEYGIVSTGYQERYSALMNYSLYEKYQNGDEPRNYAQHTMQKITDETAVPKEAEGYLTVTPAKARAMAEELLAGTGMAVSGIYLTDDENCENFGGIISPAEHYAYKLICVRNIDGIDIMRYDGSTQNGEDAFAPRWHYERMEMLVDDDGIFDFQWWAPIELTEKITENAEILPFEKIQSIFEKMILIEYEGLQEYDRYRNRELLFEIDGIELLLHRIPEADSDDTGLLVPVWCFYGAGYSVDVNGNKEPIALWTDGMDKAVLMINAIDGSILEIDQGEIY